MANKNKKYKRSIEDAGRISDEEYYNIMEGVAERNYRDWDLPNPDAALVQALNDNTYNYRGYYNKYPNGDGNAKDHWPDDFKTVYHPTFSKESKYSGKKSQYNPKGLTGGTWYGEYFVPSVDLLVERNKFEKGGSTKKPVTTGGAGYIPSVENINDILENVSGDIMEGIRKFAYPKAKVIDKNKGKGYNGGTAQRTYLLPRHIQKDIFLRDGYIEGRKGDYGLVKKAVGNRNIPVFQTAKDAITRDNLIPFSSGYRGQSNFENKFIDENKELVHAGGYPYALYIDGTNGNIYYKAWDLNDYTEDSSRLGQKGSLERKFKSIGSKVLDVVGSPTVITTGFQPVTNLGAYFGYNLPNANFQDLFQDYNKDLDIKDYPSNIGAELDYFMEGKGLHREKINNKYVYTLPEITVTRNKKSNGGSIHITPSKRGTFTTAATKHGMGVQEFAAKVLRNKDFYSPAMVKKANFARNASKWNK